MSVSEMARLSRTQRGTLAASVLSTDPRYRLDRALSGVLKPARRLELVEQAFRGLPGRYLGATDDLDATYHVRLADVGHTWEVRLTPHGARVRKGAPSRAPT